MAWLTVEDVAAAGNIAAANVAGNTALANATAAAVSFVEDKRRDLATGQAEPAFDAPDHVKHGAAMLAARLYERRGSILGVTASAGFEGAAEIVRYDPDIEQLLGVGRSRPFGFGAPA